MTQPKNKRLPGRPRKQGERNISVSVSVDPVKLKRIEKRWESLTAYLKEKFLNDNI